MMSVAPFQVYVWPQRMLALGPAFASAQHRHHTAQIAFGLDGPVIFENPQTGRHSDDMLLIPPDTPHSHPAFGAMALLYLEPESSEWVRFPGPKEGGLVSLPFNQRLRVAAHRAAIGDVVAARSLVADLIGQPASIAPREDTLISHAITLIRRSIDGPITLATLAEAVHLSPSRVAHRFREATGVPLRRYVLWCRVRRAAEAAMCGSTLTEAAHLAGFADSAHLSRTFRATFGVVPSLFLKPSLARVTFCEAAANI